ncbi:MarR family transcriptional regulator [Catellatospora sp. KI3]|uniref:MarR family winged helix-turn-helix transcriptional regulator n=1 Tax=Catellatospora sp. KI3 TaxID=3041620 RepID=UPI0024829548|nr:MarR family transcriptional regulator [Catellatospora sp. KI3]MDI1464057.1 MarR family transcriptional regulator [Catellatospora sp. KI3]
MVRQPEPPAERPAALAELISALRESSVESDVFVDVFARAHRLGRSDLNAVMWITSAAQEGTPLTAGELAARLGLGAPATTSLIDRLEASGHVERTRDPHDRRRVTLAMKPSALLMAYDFFQPLGARIETALTDLPTADLLVAAAVLRRMTAAIVESREAARA